MVCAGCQHENPAGAKFCQQCGRPLAAGAACAQCGTQLPPEARFCHACGAPQAAAARSAERERSPAAYTPNHLAEKILRSRAALEGERKQVTVLFADVKGSLELSERVDPEQWHRVLDGFLRILAEGVHRYEGTVNQYTGDGIMALFGAPIAHEDHAQRACFAALALAAELRRFADSLRVEQGLSFGVRIGLNSGEVVVGRIGDDLRMDYTAQGHTVGLAARMEQLAEPGRVFLTEHTARLVSGYFRLADLGATRVRGVSDPVGVYELLAVGDLRTRLDVSRARGFSRFVGRAAELAELARALADARAGDGRVVAVVGEAGVGKSRLCLEFEQSARAAGVAVYDAQCPPHGRLLPDLPIAELLRALFELSDADDEHAARRKIAGELLLLGAGLSESLPLALDFLGIRDPDRPLLPGDPRARRERFAALLRQLVRARAARGPIALSIDDLHWIDPASDALVAELAEAVRGAPLLLLVNFRPEYAAPWTRAAHCRTIALGPLGDEAVDEMLRELLGPELARGALGALVRERTTGNPFFVEELVQGLIESGQLEGSRGSYRLAQPVESLAIPPTVQAVVAARIDRLADAHKQVLQAAAVVGKRFSTAVLARALGRGEDDLASDLAALEQGEFVRCEQLHPEREYAFRHPLTQEIAYGSQLSDRRAELHAAVARALAASPSARLGELAPLLAEHWESARQPLDAARWHRRAAGWAGSRDFVAAERHWRRVRDLLAREALDAEARELAVIARIGLLSVAGRQGMAKDEAELLRDEARTLVTDENPGQLFYLCSAYGLTCVFAGDFAEALEVFRAAEPFAARIGGPAPVSVRVTCAWALSLLGRLEEALREVDGVLAELERDRALGAAFDAAPPGRPSILALRASVLAPLGHYDEAEACIERALEGAQAMGALDWLSVALGASAALERHRGDADRVARAGARAFEIGAKIGYLGSRLDGLSALGSASQLRGDWAQAIEHLEAALAEMQKSSNVIYEPLVTTVLADAYLAGGDAKRAIALAKSAVTASALRGVRLQELDAQLALGRALLAGGGRGAVAMAEAALARAEELLSETRARAYAPPAEELRAAIAAGRGDRAGRERALGAALALYRELGAPGHAARVERELG